MTILWDQALVDELVGRRVIIFLGAGATMSCTREVPIHGRNRTPSWPQLLNELRDAGSCDDLDRRHIAELTDKDRYLDAAEVIKSKLSSQEYARVLTAEFSRIETGTLHDAILRLDQRIVMTTNYDSAYENLCMQGSGRDGYTVLNYYDTGLTNRLRSPTRLIVKLHGSVKQPERTVLTKSDYFEARFNNSRFFDLIGSLFATNTLLFLGYSLSDPDIQLLLETSNIGGEGSFQHYAVVPAGSHQAVGRAISRSYGINLIEYDSSEGHQVVADRLSDLADTVEDARAPLQT